MHTHARKRPAPQGFLGREIIEDFNYFAETAFKLFGDRVKKWVT